MTSTSTSAPAAAVAPPIDEPRRRRAVLWSACIALMAVVVSPRRLRFVTENQGDEVEQFSDATREQLRSSAAALAAALERHTAALLELSGGAGSLPTLIELNDEIRWAVSTWDDAVFDHTGTFPLAIELLDEEELVEDDDEAESEQAVTQLSVTVVGRWDVDVTDADALITAGRAAYARMNPSETDADEVIAPGESGVALALDALVHEYDEPWFDLPGVEAVAGYRAYLRRDDDEPSLVESDQDDQEPPLLPSGRVLFSESW